MKLELNKIYHGFKLTEEKEIREIGSLGKVFLHEKSGARLFYLENEDDNKVFSISFRTPPKDSTGVAHILEHSVLCGSRKFPTKEPFVELLKGSLNTFLNAMTFPDKTMYPVASRNDKDFQNLMDVYLDAVFYPNIYKDPQILMQEGWHYELENVESDLTYKGVVYNEMKGAFSSPDSVLFRKIQESLFPETPYGVESGGDPDVIPKLTQEEFLDFHKKYYHPSNSYIFLYGKLDVVEQLKFIDEAYLKEFTAISVDSKISLQPPFTTGKEMNIGYPITPGEKEEDKSYISLNYVIGTSLDTELCMAFDILEHLLLETSAAPLKKALLDENIGKDIFGSFESSILQPVFSVVAKNTNIKEKERFISIVKTTLEKIVQDGIDKKLIEASINIKEFTMREADYGGYPKGLIYGIKCMESWLYEGSPFDAVVYEKALKKVKEALTTNYFEELIQKYLLNNGHHTVVLVEPKKGIEEEKVEKVKKELQEYKQKLSSKEVDQIIKETQDLKNKQETPDSKEALGSIPVLSLEDVEKNVEKLPLLLKEESGIPVLAHHMFTSHIVYLNLYFDAKKVPQELLPYVGVLVGILGDIRTEKYSYEDLTNEVNIHTGGIYHAIDVYSEKDTDEIYNPKFVFKAKAMADKVPKLLELLAEQICHSDFTDKKRIKELVQELKSRLEMMIFQQGHMIAASRATSYFSPSGKYSEIVKGLTFYNFITEIEENFENRADEFMQNLKRVAENIFNKNNLMVSITVEEEEYEIFKENFHVLHDELKDEKLPENTEYDFKCEAKNEGLMTSAKVQYVTKAYNYNRLGYKYNGSLQVAKTIISKDYLWNKVRVLGGAYGAFAKFEKNGNMFFGSYRDPNLTETLSAYDGVAEYLKTFEGDEREMTKYILGTIRDFDMPLTPSMKGEKATIQYIKRITLEELQREREEILSTTEKDIRGFSKLIEDMMTQKNLCVVGNEEKIRENGAVFGEILNIMQ